MRIVCGYKFLVKLSPLCSALIFETGSSGSLLEPCRWRALTLSEPTNLFAVPYALLTYKNRSSSSPSLLKPLMGKLIKVLCSEWTSFSCQIIKTFQTIFQEIFCPAFLVVFIGFERYLFCDTARKGTSILSLCFPYLIIRVVPETYECI